MTKFIFTPLDMYIEEEKASEVKRIDLPVKLIAGLNIKNINPQGKINVEITLNIDEIDVEYSTIFKKRTQARKKLRDELSKET